MTTSDVTTLVIMLSGSLHYISVLFNHVILIPEVSTPFRCPSVFVPIFYEGRIVLSAGQVTSQYHGHVEVYDSLCILPGIV